ncbi:MAG: CHAT domain-containing protein [Cyanobacteria bacterium P01_C01_bin.89]
MRILGGAIALVLLMGLPVGAISVEPGTTQQSSSIAQALDRQEEKKQRADSLLQEGIQQQQSDQFEEALQSFQAARELFQEIGDRAGEGTVLNEIGRVHRVQSQYAQALDYYQQALVVNRAAGEPGEESIALNNIGAIYKNRGQYAQAFDYYQQALAIRRKTGDRAGEANLLGNIGAIYHQQSQYAQTLDYYQQALAIYRELNNRVGEIIFLNNIGGLYSSQGQYVQALDYYWQALEIAGERNDASWQGLLLNNIGSVYHDQGKYGHAFYNYHRALAVNREFGYRIWEGTSLSLIGSFYLDNGEYAQALDNYQQALEIARERVDRVREGSILLNIGYLHSRQEQHNQALSYYQQALKISREMGARATESTVLSNIGYLHSGQGKYGQAAAYFRQSISVFETIEKDSVATDQSRVALFEKRAHTYNSLISSLANQSKTAAALDIADRSRARSLAQFLNPSAENKPPTPLNIEQIKQMARDKNATLITYSIIEKELYIWVVDSNALVTFRKVSPEATSVPLRAITSQIRRSASAPFDVSGFFSQNRFRLDLQSLRGGEGSLWRGGPKDLKRAYKLLIKPIENLLPTQGSRLIIVPHRELGTVPFAALIDDRDRFLLDRYALSITPSLQTLHTVQQTQPTGTAAPLIVGNPTPMPDQLSDLPDSETEAIAIAQALGTTALTGKNATETTVKQRLQNASILHFATHGVVANSDRQIDDTWLALADIGTGEEDGKLTLTEIFNTPLNAQLAVLSACNTNSGEVTGEGVLGLARAFLKSGVPTVIATLWKVPDTETHILMEAFYRELLTGKTYAEALRIAQLEVRAQSPNPRNWAAFVVIGEGDRTLELP